MFNKAKIKTQKNLKKISNKISNKRKFIKDSKSRLKPRSIANNSRRKMIRKTIKIKNTNLIKLFLLK